MRLLMTVRGAALTTLLLAATMRVCDADEVVFAPTPAWAGPSEVTRSIALGDIDGDGDLDLVRGNYQPGTTLYLNNGGTFAETAAWTGPQESTASVALGDIDGDGDLDLVRGNYRLQGTTLYLNEGGTFANAPVWTGPEESTASVALGDVDGDGDLDLVRGNLLEGATLYLNIGGTFATTPAWIGPVERTQSVALGDVDGDGDLDLIRGNYSGTEGATLYINIGGTFSAAPAWTGQAELTLSIALGDIDGDGDLDLVRGNVGQGATLYLNLGGTFTGAPAWTGVVDMTTGVSLGDVDGDGDLDLVCGNSNLGTESRPATLYLNVGGTFTLAPAWTGPAEITACVALGDVNGDGDLDLVRGNFGEGATLYLNTAGAFALTPGWTGPIEDTRAVALADVDGDGDLDLVRGNYSLGTDQSEPATLYLNVGGTFTLAPAWMGPPEFTEAVAVGDVDGDGNLDLVCGNSRGGSTLHLNTGGYFNYEPAWIGPEEPTAGIALGDVDDDGDLDLVLGNDGPGTTLFLNEGGRFGSAPAWNSLPEATHSVVLGDVDGDNDLDLVMGSTVQSAVLYLNVGGTFAAVPEWTGPVHSIWSVTLGDVNGDGRLDLVCGGQITSLFLNIGGKFAASPAWTGALEFTSSVALGDVDGDGDLDLVRGNGGSPSTLYPNQGGVFAPARTWAGPDLNTSSVAMGDVDSDGDIDMVLGGDASALFVNRNPWLLPQAGGLPASTLSNNPAHLRWVGVTPAGPNRYRVSFRAVDVEADPLWLAGEYEFEGSASWHPMMFEGSSFRIGPFTTSLGGLEHDVTWNVELLPFDPRNVVIRLHATSTSRRGGAIQFTPSFLDAVGRIVPQRPAMAATPSSIVFPTVTVGDSQAVYVSISNLGTQDLVVDRIDVPDPAVLLRPLGLVVPPGRDSLLEVTLAPIRKLNPLGPLRIHGNDPTTPTLDIPLAADVRPLAFETRLLTAGPALPLGDAATVVVTPAPQVHLEGGLLNYRARGSPAPADTTPLVAQGSTFMAVIPGERVTETGVEYYILVENSDVFAADPPTAPDSMFYAPVISPAAISVQAQQDVNGGFPVGRAVPIIVSLPRGTEFKSGRIFYRAGGAAAYDSVDIGPGEVAPGVFSTLVPDSAVGPRGLEYWVQVRTSTRALTDPAQAQDPSNHPRTVRTRVPSLAETEAHEGNRYRMVSVPLDLGLPVATSLEAVLFDQPEFGSYDPLRWRSFRYDPEISDYVEPSASTTSGGKLRPEPGRGFWLIAKSSNRIDTAPVAGRSTPTDAPFIVTLAHGWNQIGNPFLFPVAWSDVDAHGAGGAVALEPPVAWDEASSQYRDPDVTVLKPFTGYWVKNPTAEPVQLSIPPHEASPVGIPAYAAETSADSIAWRLQIIATSGHASDSRNFAGVAPPAQSGQDALDRSDPPPAPGGLSLYFLGAEEDAGVRRTVDIRDPIPYDGEPATRGHRWLFDIVRPRGDPGSPEVRLQFAGLDRVPSGVALRLVDRALKQTKDLRRQPEVVCAVLSRGFVPRSSDARFELLAGTPAFVERIDAGFDAGPVRSRIASSFPNPAEANSVIRFEIARAGRVTLSVFNLTGERVRTLVDGDRPVGIQEFVWRCDDGRGHRVPPGMYFLKLSAPDRVDTRKLIRID